MKINKKRGILFWITGFSGSGKSSIAKKLKGKIEKSYGKTIILSGDNFRRVFKFKKYDKNSRLEIGKKYSNFLNIILKQKINIIFTVVGLIDELRYHNKSVFKNYLEIFIKANIKKILKESKKKHYMQKQKNIMGLDIKPEFPKKPRIKVYNNFNKSSNFLAYNIYKKIKNIIKKN